MCAFIDDLLDAFGDEVESRSNLHPYLPETYGETADETPHGKLKVQLWTYNSEDEVVASSVEMASSPRTYSPTNKHHRYLPLPKASQQLAEDSNQENAKIVSSTAISVDGGRDVPNATEDKVKPFRPNTSLQPYLFEATTHEQGSLDSTWLEGEKQNRDLESRNSGVSKESPVEKLDIDAMLAALPPHVTEADKPISCHMPMYANPKEVLETNPDLHGQIGLFLGCETKGLRDFSAIDVTFLVQRR
jgi:hypothetical protein